LTGIGSDWTLVNPNVMASETGSNNNNNNTLTGTTTSHGGGGGTMLGFFLTNETALCITLVLGIFFLAANLILFAAIYRRRVACGRGRNVNKQNNEQEDEGGDTNLQVSLSIPFFFFMYFIFFFFYGKTNKNAPKKSVDMATPTDATHIYNNRRYLYTTTRT
jgi:phosphotransferase system  glucose/maltose/N-acetylglucosamine-specific IIC component